MTTNTNFHVVVIGSRPEKDAATNRYLPMPQENVDYIASVLDRLSSSNYSALYHNASTGVAEVVDDYAFNKHIRVKQFPAYWFKPDAPNHRDNSAGIVATEQMIRHAKDAVFQKDDQNTLVLAFYNTDTPEESREVDHAVKFASNKGVDVRTYQLPVTLAKATADTAPANPF